MTWILGVTSFGTLSATALLILCTCHPCSDQYTPNGTRANEAPRPVGYKNSYQPRWDAWGRLTQPAFSSRLMQGLHGNHEVPGPGCASFIMDLIPKNCK